MYRRYSELIKLDSYEDRFNYLKLDGIVGEETFGVDRYLNQMFYNSYEWKEIRRDVIARDEGNDMATDGFPIRGRIIIHHMNPISLDDLMHRADNVLDPEYLISVAHQTHEAIHYGDINLTYYAQLPIKRAPNDTIPWR